MVHNPGDQANPLQARLAMARLDRLPGAWAVRRLGCPAARMLRVPVGRTERPHAW